MPDGVTPNLQLVKPEVAASPDTWGNKTNDNWDKLDLKVVYNTAQWSWTLGDGNPTSTAGPIFVTRYGNDGIAIDNPMSINRQTGEVTVPNNLSVGLRATAANVTVVHKLTFSTDSEGIQLSQGGQLIDQPSRTALCANNDVLDILTEAGGNLLQINNAAPAPVWKGVSYCLLSSGDQTLTGGFRVTPYNNGTFSGTFQPDPKNGNYQYGINNGGFTFVPPASDCAIDVLVVNGASAAGISFSGWNTSAGNVGDAYSTVNGGATLVSVRRMAGYAMYKMMAVNY